MVAGKRIDNSRLLRQRDPASVQECLALLGLAMLCLGVLLFCASQHLEYVRTGYEREKLQAQHDQVLEWNRTLQLEQAALLDPERIDALARNQLGLESPRAGQWVFLHSGEAESPALVLAQVGEEDRPARPSTPD